MSSSRRANPDCALTDRLQRPTSRVPLHYGAQAGRPPAGSALAMALAEVDDDDDEGGDCHVCMVCKEGYRQQPVRAWGGSMRAQLMLGELFHSLLDVYQLTGEQSG